MEEHTKKDSWSFLPVLYVLLAIDGILTVLLAAGIVWFGLHPAESVEIETDTGTVTEREQQSPYGPRTMISTYSIRAEERGWETKPEEIVKPNNTSGQEESEPENRQSEQQAQNPAEDGQSNPAPVSTPQEPQGQNPQSGQQPERSNTVGGNWGEESTTNEITGSLSKTAYWVTSGKSYHFSQNCPSLARSNNIQTGTLQEALNAGKTDPCNNCANGS